MPTKLLLPRFSSLSGVRKMHKGECSIHRNVKPRRHRCNSETAHLASTPTSTPHQRRIDFGDDASQGIVRWRTHVGLAVAEAKKHSDKETGHSQDVGVVHVARQLIPLVGAWVTSEPVAVIVPLWSFCGVVPSGQRIKGGMHTDTAVVTKPTKLNQPQ